jgi:hypothetical protein
MPVQDEAAAGPGEERGWRDYFPLVGEVPSPPVELLEWPDPAPTLPVRRFCLPPEREGALRRLLPTPGATAWETARTLTEWVSRQWLHANDHVDRYDAVEILERVAAGARVACDEYTVVLCHALNAVGIPARWLGLFRRDHHAGVGGGPLGGGGLDRRPAPLGRSRRAERRPLGGRVR